MNECINNILESYKAGEKTLEQANTELEMAVTNFHSGPEKKPSRTKASMATVLFGKNKRFKRIRNMALELLKLLIPVIPTVCICILNINSNQAINEKITETNLLIADKTNAVTQELNYESQIENECRYITEIMLDNIGTNKANIISAKAQSLIASLNQYNSDKADDIQSLLDEFKVENEIHWDNKTQEFHRHAADCFSNDRALREQGLTYMLDNFDVKNIDGCIKSMLDIAIMAEEDPEEVRILGFENFSYFLTRYTNVNIWRKYAKDNEDLDELIYLIYDYGGAKAENDIMIFEYALSQSE